MEEPNGSSVHVTEVRYVATVASLVVDLTANTARFHRNMTQAQRTMQQFRRTAMSVTRTLDDVARVGKKAAVGLAAITAAATGVLQTTATFERSMMRVKAVSQASVAEYKAMEKAALDMAKATQYTAQQVAEGMGYMAMAGFKSNEIIGAMPTVLRLATAGMMDLATSADIVTNILTGYGLAVEDLGAATDVLVSAMTGANVDLKMLGESFKYVGPIAKGAGVSFEVTAAAIALLGNAGIQGSMAGTSLRQALSRLLNPTKAVQDRLKKLGVQTKTATGELLPFEDIITQLEKSGATAADMMEIFGDRAGPAMTALVSQGSDALMTFIDRLRESGGLAERIEKEQLNTLSGQWDILKSQIQGVAITLGQDLMPYARTLIYIGQQIVSLFDNLDASQRAQIVQWVALGGAILGIVSVLGVTAFAISAFIKGLLLLGSVVGLLTSPLVIGLTLIALGVAGLKTAWDNNWLGIRDKTVEIVDVILEKWESLKTWWDTSDFGQKVREAWDRIKEVWASDELTLPQKVLKTVSIVAETIADLSPSIRAIWDTWTDDDLSLGQKILKTVSIVAEGVAGLVESIMAWWTGITLELVKRGATLLGLDPDDLWIVQFLEDLNDIWKSEDLSFGEKVVETIRLIPGGQSLIDFINDIRDVWKDSELSLPEKIIETVKLTVSAVTGLIESIVTWWINTSVTLSEKVVSLLGLDPEENALVGFLRKLQEIWNNEELEFAEKVVESLKLIPGVKAISDFVARIKQVWADTDLTLGEKVIKAIDISLDQAVVRIGLALLGAVLSWKVLPGALKSLGPAITAATSALATGGLVLGKITVAGVLLALTAGAIGWAFGDKEGRAAWIDAIHQSLKEINMDEPVSIPISIMGVLEATFKFGTQGIQNMRTAIQEYKNQLEEWTPQMGVGKLEIPEWLRKFVDLGLSVSEFFSQGFLLGFDLVDLLMTAIDKAVAGVLNVFLEAGKKLGNAILDGIASVLDKLLPDFLTPDWVKKRVETMQAQQEAALSVTEQERRMLAALVQLEARTEGLEGMAAVAEVVFNRMAANPEYYGKTVEEVIRKAGQFEPVVSGAFDMLLESGQIAADAIEAVDLALRRLAEGAGVTAGATHFANLDIVQRRYEAAMAAGRSYAGAWFLDPTQFISTGTIGRHTFGYGSWERYQSGTPWTGWGPLDEVVGVVHRREAVIPWEALRKGIPGVLEFLGVPGFQTGRTVSIPGLVEAQSTVTTMNDMFRSLGKTILAGLAKLFEIIAGAIEALAVALVGEEKVAEIKAVFAQMRAGLQDYIDGLSGMDSFGNIVKDTTEQVDGLSSALEGVIAAVEDTLKTWVRKVPILSDALAAYENAVKSQEEGGLGMNTAYGIAAAALAALTASSEELKRAIDAVSQGFAALLQPLNELLRSFGPTGSGTLVGAGIGYGAAALLGINPLIGLVVGGIMGLFGGAAQQQAQAAELQIQAANELVQAARSMSTEARYGAIDQMRRSIAETERTISDLQASISGVTTAGAVGGGIAGAAIGFALFGPLGLLVGGLFGAAAGGSIAHSMRQDEIEAITKQLEAQRESLNQLIEDFKSVLGITVSDLVSSVRSAFSAETVEAFSAQLETSLLMHVRNALIAGFLESAAMRPLFETLSNQIFEAVRDGVTSAGELDAIRDTISQISDHSEQFYSVLDELGLGMKDLKKNVDSVNSALRNVPSGFKIALRRFQVADPIPLAEGGIVTRPTFAMVGERGPEAVVPLDEAGGKVVVEVHVEGSIYADDFEDRVRRAVVKGARDAGLGRYGLAGDVAWA